MPDTETEIEIVKDEETFQDVLYPSLLTLLTLAANSTDSATSLAALGMAAQLLNEAKSQLSIPAPKQTLNFIDGDGLPLRFELDAKTGYWHDSAGIAYDIDPAQAGAMQKEMDELRVERTQRAQELDLWREKSAQVMREAIERERLASAARAEQDRFIAEKLKYLDKCINTNAKSDPEDSYLRRLQAHVQKALAEPGLGENFDPAQFARINAAYEKHAKGQVANESDIPKPENFTSLMGKTFFDTAEEVARGESWGAMGIRIGVGILTVGASEMAFAPAQAFYSMKDYVDKGGDSAVEAFLLSTKQVLIDEITGRALEGAIGKVTDKLKAGNFKAQNEVFDELSKTAKQKADDLIRANQRTLNTQSARNTAFERGQSEGRRKALELNAASLEVAANPNSASARQKFDDAMMVVQGDKYAQNVMNRYTGDRANTLRGEMNNRMTQYIRAAEENAKIRIAQEYGVTYNIHNFGGTNVQTMRATSGMKSSAQPATGKFANKPGTTTLSDAHTRQRVHPDDIVIDQSKTKTNKISIDNDETFRVKQLDPATGKFEFRDVPEDVAGRIYNEEWYKAHHKGQLPTTTVNGKVVVDDTAMKKFAKDMDQTVLDFKSLDAYGSNPREVQKILSDIEGFKYVSDVEGLAKTMDYKGVEWFNRAEHLAEAAKFQPDQARVWQLASLSEAYRAEGMRQATKQFNNLTLKQAAAINKVKAGAVKIPEKLRTGMAVMERVGQGLSPQDAEKILKGMGLTPESLSRQSADLIEAMQKLQ